MTEKSVLWDTNGTGDGTGTGFTETDMIQLFRSLFTRTANLGGVVPDYLNELAVTGTATPVAVNTGAGLCYGIPYWNTASVNVTIATPAVSTRVDRIVLRADWTLQTVRITRIAGTEGAGAPAMTQTAGTTWDIPLATVSITTGGVITVTDAREWLLGTGDGTIDSTKLADGAALAEILDDDGAGSGLDADLLDGSHAAAFATSGHTHPGAVDARTGLSSTNGIVADTANGDARGTDATDLQTIRTNTSEVASGASSVVAGGRRNTASATYSAVIGGYGAIARLYGQEAFATGFNVNPGELQRSIYTLWGYMAGGGGDLYLDGTSLRLTVPTNTSMAFDALIVGRCPADDKSAAYRIMGLISNDGGTTALVGSINKTVIAEGDAGYDATITADNPNDALVIAVTGHAIGTYWVATVNTVEVNVGG